MNNEILRLPSTYSDSFLLLLNASVDTNFFFDLLDMGIGSQRVDSSSIANSPRKALAS